MKYHSVISSALIGITLFTVLTGVVAIRRTHKGSNDFDTFYEAGQNVLARKGIYYTGEYYDINNKISPFLYLPIAACFFSLFAWLPISFAAFIWNFLNIAFFFICLLIPLAMLGYKIPDLPMLWQTSRIRDKLLFLFFSSAIFLDNLLMGQINILVFLLCLVALYLWQKKYFFTAGFILSAAILLKLTPSFFVLYFLIKRQWKLLAGTMAGFLIFLLLIPSVIFGPETSRVYHRQWTGRTIKPLIIGIYAKLRPELAHPLKMNPENIEHIRLANLLNPKNQALDASLTRLLLKDRNVYATSGSFPVLVGKKYKNLPVLAGGIPKDTLQAIVTVIKLTLLMLMIVVFHQAKNDVSSAGVFFEISLLFLSLPLLSPIARSHQFISWLFAALVLLILFKKNEHQPLKEVKATFIIAFFLYSFQSIPYGKAAGFGTWSNLLLWFSFVFMIPRIRRKEWAFTNFSYNTDV